MRSTDLFSIITYSTHTPSRNLSYEKNINSFICVNDVFFVYYIKITIAECNKCSGVARVRFSRTLTTADSNLKQLFYMCGTLCQFQADWLTCRSITETI